MGMIKEYFLKVLRGQYMSTRLVLLLDTLLSTLATFISFIGVSAMLNAYLMPRSVIIVATAISFVVSAAFMYLFKTHLAIIRHMMLRELARFFAAIVCKEVVLVAYLLLGTKLALVQWASVIVIDFLLTFFALMALRTAMQVVYRMLTSSSRDRRDTERVLVYGAGDKAASLVTRLQNSPHYRIVGFVKYSTTHNNLKIADLPVYYFNDVNDIAHVQRKANASVLLFAHRSDARAEEDRLLKHCKKLGLKALYAPSIDSVSGSSDTQAVREINIEDLLERPEITLSMNDIIANFRGKTVLVTGAAGSIGSELCRQLAGLDVKQLIMFDNAETPMHNLRLEFEDRYPELNFVPVIGDVRSRERLEWAFTKYKPQVVFHAAAYKHVPLMEENPCEAVLANVIGSRNVADKCLEHDVEMMVMISTDKAVNPTNIMGCTKRIAEIYVQALGLAIEHGTIKGKTRFVTTRFGNVLGSNGSVIPRFTEQIAKGGPVTVTHPEITRFFMTIPEACKLVMEAATISIGNQIFVFDMGRSVKIAHLAERMIRLAGFTPGKDIKIEYTGLRPGEKLYEEVLSNEENTIPTGHNRIRIAKVREHDYDCAVDAANQLEQLAVAVSIEPMVRLMKHLVPEFKSKNSPFERLDTPEGTPEATDKQDDTKA